MQQLPVDSAARHGIQAALCEKYRDLWGDLSIIIIQYQCVVANREIKNSKIAQVWADLEEVVVFCKWHSSHGGLKHQLEIQSPCLQ